MLVFRSDGIPASDGVTVSVSCCRLCVCQDFFVFQQVLGIFYLSGPAANFFYFGNKCYNLTIILTVLGSGDTSTSRDAQRALILFTVLSFKLFWEEKTK